MFGNRLTKMSSTDHHGGCVNEAASRPRPAVPDRSGHPRHRPRALRVGGAAADHLAARSRRPGLLLDDEPFSDPAELFITYDHYVTRLLHAAGVDLADARRRTAARRPIPRRGLAHLRRALAPLRGHRIGLLAHARARRRSSTSTYEPSADDGRCRLRRDRRAPRRARISPARPVRALRHRGARDHRRPDGRPRRCTRRSPPIPSFTGRVLPTFRPDAYLDPTAPGFRRAHRAAHRRERHRTRRLRRLPRGARGAPGALHRARRGLGRPRSARALHRRPDRRRGIRAVPACRRRRPRRRRAREFRGQHAAAHGGHERARRARHDRSTRASSATTRARRSTASAPTPATTSRSRRRTPRTCARCSSGTVSSRACTSSCSRVDETVYSREVAPLAGFYPSVFIGAPWWFLDAPDAILRFRAAVTETAGFYRGSGFIDDTRAFLSIPARHDMARRLDSAFLARLVREGRVSPRAAERIAVDLVDAIPRKVFKL